jgi:protein-glutamine gamma-glutamyltransferase
MSFNTYFRLSSYATLAVAMLALFMTGSLHIAWAVAFALVMILAWRFDGTKWQLSERAGLILVLLSLPIFYLDWIYLEAHLSAIETGATRTNSLISAISHLIVFLSSIKLLQVKSDRDWVFLYLISFFEVLLAAGLSVSPIFIVPFSVYLVSALSTVMVFEIRKAKRAITASQTRLLVPPDSIMFRRLARRGRRRTSTEVKHLPIVSFALLALILLLALPLFLVAPRSGAAAFTRGGGGGNFIGFSENVTLGEIGTLKQSDQVVMHVRVEGSPARTSQELRWRGIALDEFTGRGWKRSLQAHRLEQRTNERGFFQLGTTEALQRLTIQRFFLEPLDTPVLFAAPRAVALEGSLPFIRVDSEGSIQSRRHEFERLMYKAYSDTTEPDPDILRRDRSSDTVEPARYLQLPAGLDPRIGDLARAMIVNQHARNRYDEVKAIESQLKSDYGYTLEMKAEGPDPLSDFLFNVRAGHCEYFSSAMVVMLRTQRIAARVVNGFLSGEYNDAAGAYTVRQSDAHSWVEVYFPESNSWVTFDPTPAAGRAEPRRAGLAGWFGKYAEAFELMWFQYVVGYDKQEQRSLATSLNNRLFQYRRSITAEISEWKQAAPRLLIKLLYGVGAVAFLILLLVLIRRARKLGWRRALSLGRKATAENSSVEFYERLTKLLADRGLKRAPDQTPLEFATVVNLREAHIITRAYHRVRYGAEKLSAAEMNRIEDLLRQLQTGYHDA